MDEDSEEETTNTEVKQTTDTNLSPAEVKLRLHRFDLKFGKENANQVNRNLREEHMCKGLCLHCGKPGHFIVQCNQRRNEQGRSVQDETTEQGRAMYEKHDEDNFDDSDAQWGPYFPENHLNA